MFKKLSIILVSALLAGVVIFSACNKEDEKSDGTKAGEELCACIDGIDLDDFDEDDEASNFELLGCALTIIGKYNMKWDDDAEDFVFNNASDQKDFDAAIAKCGW